jgi:hypothetical protein
MPLLRKTRQLQTKDRKDKQAETQHSTHNHPAHNYASRKGLAAASNGGKLAKERRTFRRQQHASGVYKNNAYRNKIAPARGDGQPATATARV